jgi:hypothetical protein
VIVIVVDVISNVDSYFYAIGVIVEDAVAVVSSGTVVVINIVDLNALVFAFFRCIVSFVVVVAAAVTDCVVFSVSMLIIQL